MPETVPGITFNQEGVCSFCNSFRAPRLLGEETLNRIVRRAKALQRPYDAIVPLSGGRDSSYVLYLAKTKYDLDLLAVNYDSEFRSEQALLNIENACRRLNVEFVSIRSGRNPAKRFVRNTIKAAGSPREFNIYGLCGYGNMAVIWNTARASNVPLVLWGSASIEPTPAMIS